MVNLEPNPLIPIFLIWIMPFVAYYLGVVIRKVSMPNEVSPSLGRQFLMAIPVCLIVVAPIVATLNDEGQLSQNASSYLFTLGVIIEHGMLMQKKLTELLSGRVPVISPT